MAEADRIAIIGGGNLGTAIARGLAASGQVAPEEITITRRSIHLLEGLKQEGFRIEQDNQAAVRAARIVLVTVRPRQLNSVLRDKFGWQDVYRNLYLRIRFAEGADY